MKKLFSLLLALALLVTVFSVSGVPAQAKAKLKYSTKTINNTITEDCGTYENWVKYPVFKGRSKGIKAINKSLKKKAKEHVANSREIVDYMREEYSYTHNPLEYFFTATMKPAFNNGKIICVKVFSEGYTGGTSHDAEYYGYTYNVKTGKKIKLENVVRKAYNPAKKSGYKKLRKYIASKLRKQYSDDHAENFLQMFTQKRLRKTDFYVNKNGTAYICFGKYEVGYGVDGCIRIKLPSKYA